MTFVRSIECSSCNASHEGPRLTVCRACGRMLVVRYDTERVRGAVTPERLRGRPRGMYRFHELLPLEDGSTPVTLGEGSTSLLFAPRLAGQLGIEPDRLRIKDEGTNPTGTFKAR